jgi:hypothetical protein
VDELTSADIELILESLRYTKEKFSTYRGYPSEEFRQGRIADVDTAIAHVQAIHQGRQLR